MAATVERIAVPVTRLEASAYTVPTDRPESDGTFEWSETTLVLVEAHGGGETGLGWTYGLPAAAGIVADELADVVEGSDLALVGAAWLAMRSALRNSGYAGPAALAVSAVDVALWDLHARVLGVPLATLVGAVREQVPVYGSGGFCSYTDEQLADQLAGWVEDGIPRVKMKVGREPERDVARVRVAREAVGPDAELYVDANGALTPRSALAFAERFAELGVSWFEEPVTSDDVDGLRLVRDRVPAGMEVAAGEYATKLGDFRRLIGAVDCLQADVTRCGGITGLLAAGALAEACELDLSGHCAPTIHAHGLCAVRRLRHLEWFHDHVRIERLLFDGVPEPAAGLLAFDPSRPGLGVELRRADAERFAVR